MLKAFCYVLSVRSSPRASLGGAADANTPRGLLTLTAPVLFGRLKVRPVSDRFLDDNTAVQARLVLLDRVVNMLDEGIDVAIRLAHLPDSSLHATHLGEVRRLLCASPAYIARHGRPATPADLSDHACIMVLIDRLIILYAVIIGQTMSASVTLPIISSLFGPKRLGTIRIERVLANAPAECRIVGHDVGDPPVLA